MEGTNKENLKDIQEEFMKKESQVDAVHHRFKNEDPAEQAKYELENYYYCGQCRQYFAPTVLALHTHFREEMVTHRSCGSCRYCSGKVYEYSLNNQSMIYHNCPRPER